MLIHRDEPLTSLVFSSDNSLLFAGSAKGAVNVWEVKTKCSFSPIHLFTFEGTKDTIKCLALSSDNSYCVGVQTNGTLGVWSKEELGYPCLLIRQSTINIEQVLAATFKETWQAAEEGNTIARKLLLLVVSANRTIITIDVENVLKGIAKVTTDVSKKHLLTSPAHSLAVFPGGRYIASATNDFFDVLDTSKSILIVNEQLDQKSYVQSMAFSHDAKFVVCGEKNGSVWVWHMLKKRKIPILNPLPEDRDIESLTAVVTFSPKVDYILASLTSPRGGRLRVIKWDSVNGTVLSWDFLEVARAVSSVSFSADNRMVVAGTTNGTIWVWDLHETKYRKPNREQ
jgi:WD40 repeat protein